MTDTKINSSFDLFKIGGSLSTNFSPLADNSSEILQSPQTAPVPSSANEKCGFGNSDLLKFRLLNKAPPRFSDEVNAPNNAERVFKTVGGEWRIKNGDAADTSGTTLFDEQFYQKPGGIWIELNTGGRLCALPENKDKPRPETISEFEWRGWCEVSAADVPADYSAEGKTVAFANTELANNQKSVFKRYIVDQNLVRDWDEVLGERLIDGALQKGAHIEVVPTGKINSEGKTIYTVKMNADSLRILRGEIKDYNHELELGERARNKGAQEATNDVMDMGGAIYETVRHGVEIAINSAPDALNTVFQTAPSCQDKSIPSFGRVKLGTSFDRACAQNKNSTGGSFPTLDTSAIKYDFRSEWMRRDINGKLDGKGIKQGEATTFIAGQIAPIVVGKVITPIEPPQSLRSLDALPKESGLLEYQSDFQVRNPSNLEQTFTDIDKFDGKILWEEKSATNAINPITGIDSTPQWIAKNITAKFEKILEARKYLPPYYKNAEIDFDFTSPGADLAFKKAVEAEIQTLSKMHPEVKIRVRWR